MAVDRERIEALAQTDRRAHGVLRGLQTLSFQLSGAQLGITVSSLLLGFVLDSTLGEMFTDLLVALGLPRVSSSGFGVAVALIVATAAQMVLGELVPKNLAIAKPLGTAYAAVNPMRAVNTLFKPLIVFFNAAANWTVRLLGIEPQEELIPVRSREELELLIETSHKEGTIPSDQFSLLSRSISFGDKTASDALIPRVDVVALQFDDPLTRMVEITLQTGFSRFPVYGSNIDDIVGIVHVKDYYSLDTSERVQLLVRDIMREAFLVPESRPLSALLLDMRAKTIQIAVVVDEYGGTAGIITLEDVLEEIVGEIEDEHDPVEPDVPVGKEGVHVLSSTLHPDEVREATGFEMPEGDFETLAGFLLSLFARIPDVGDHIGYADWEFKVVEMDGRRIAKVLVVAPPRTREETR